MATDGIDMSDVFVGGDDLFADDVSHHEVQLHEAQPRDSSPTLAQAGGMQEAVHDINRSMASMGLPNLEFSGTMDDTSNVIDVIRHLMSHHRSAVEEVNKANMELRRVVADRDRLKRLVKSQDNQLGNMDKKLCKGELLIQQKTKEFERMTSRVKSENKKLRVRNTRLENMDKEYRASLNRKEKELDKIRRAFRSKVHQSKPAIKRGIQMSSNLQRADGRRARWNEDVSAEQDMLQHARLAYEERLGQLEELLGAVEGLGGGDDEDESSSLLLTRVMARAARQQAASAAPPASSASSEQAGDAPSGMQAAKLTSMRAQIKALQAELETAKEVVASQHELLNDKVFASPGALPAKAAASADTVAYLEQRDTLMHEQQQLLEEEFERKRALLDEQAKKVQRGRRQLKKGWTALEREMRRAGAGRTITLGSRSAVRARGTKSFLSEAVEDMSASRVSIGSAATAQAGTPATTARNETPLTVLLQQLEASATPAMDGAAVAPRPTVPTPAKGAALPPPTPQTEKLLAHMFGPRKLNWDSLSPITSTPQRQPKSAVRRAKSARKATRRALADLAPNTPRNGEASAVAAGGDA